ncbi:MAG: DEDD exonuclease domain-containing protein [Actinomycetota bacterium]
MALGMQRSFDDLGSALSDTEFVVFDLETTGGSPASCAITEIGAVKVRGGEVVGEFQTLVNPGVPIPAAITYLTGITDDMVAGAEPIDRVLPAFLEFAGRAVLVAHNASFDTRFIAANLARHHYPAMGNPIVCTVRLARRLVRDEVPNLKLATLARALRARTSPSHRALDDARATTDVFHSLIELAGRWGVSHLDDLLWFQSSRGHPSYSKVSLAEELPRARGVYLFRGEDDTVLYVGKATDLRSRVRQYFGGDDRRHIDDLLRDLARIDHVLCATDLDASVLEARLIRAHSPAYNRAQRGRRAQWFLTLTDERFPRLSATRRARSSGGAPDGALGPLASTTAAAVREAIEEATCVRTCTPRITARTSIPVCVRGQIGRCPAPCDGAVDPNAYAEVLDPVRRALGGDPTRAIETLAARIEHLSSASRFEEAASTRDRLSALVEAARAGRAVNAVRDAGRIKIAVGSDVAIIEAGSLVSVNGQTLPIDTDGHPDEERLIAGWLARNVERIRLIACDGEFATPLEGGRIVAEWFERIRKMRLTAAPGADPLPRAPSSLPAYRHAAATAGASAR